jgi:hypothetical protein
MPKLRVTFEDMFLVANGNLRGGSVLLPAAGHTLKIETADYVEVTPLTQVEIRFDNTVANQIVYCVDRQSRHSRPANTRLVRLEDVFAGPVKIRKRLLWDAVPPELNARVLLPEGIITAREPRLPGVKDVLWTAGEAKHQHLTDKIAFERPNMPDDTDMVISLADGTKITHRLKATDGVFDVTISNNDKPCAEALSDQDDWVLDQYEILFGLTDSSGASANERKRAYPRATFKMPKRDRSAIVILSKCLPICGGAQCDPEHPPV